MAEIDSSVYFKQQQPDFFGAYQKGLNMKDMLDERNQQKAIKNVYNGAMTTNPDGSTSFDSKKVVQGLGQAGLGQQAFEAQQKFDGESKRKQLEQLQLSGQLLGSAVDQNTWIMAKQKGAQMGLDVSQIPDQYDPRMKQYLQGQTLTAAQQLENEIKERQIRESRAERMMNTKITSDDRRYVADQSAAATKASLDEKRTEKANEPILALDKDYAKDFNDFTTKGAVNSRKGIEKLKLLSAELKGKTGFFDAGGGRASILPDAMRNQDSIRIREAARNAANTTLKDLFGGQLSDGERIAASQEYYNDKLDNKANADILDAKVAQLEENYKNQIGKASYFKQNGTLKGYGANALDAEIKSPQENTSGGNAQAPVLKTSDIDWAD